MPAYSRKMDIPGKTAQELYDKVASEIERILAKGPLPIGKFDIQKDPAKKTVQLKSSMVDATLICGEGSLTLDAKLSIFAAPFRGKIDEGIERWLGRTFNVPATKV